MMKVDHTIRDSLNGRTLMIIEPSVNYRNSLKGFLTNMKISDFRFVSSVRDAQIAMLTCDVGLIICEWQLQGTNGIQFCRDLKRNKTYQTTPFLLLSVENLRKDVILASEVGIDGYLLKPFSYEEFRDAIRLVVRTKKAPSQINALIDEGLNYLANGNLGDAEVVFQQALAANPMSARAFCGLAHVASARGRIRRAISLYKSALEVNPDYVEGLKCLLELCLEHESVDEWLPLAGKAHELSPENPKYTLILARAMLELQKYDDSEKFFKRTIRLSPRLAEAYKGLGKLYLIQDDYDSAMKHFKKALDFDKSDISLLNSLGLTYVKMGKYEEGIEKYLSALQMDPSDYRILFNMGYAKEKVGDLEKARHYYSQALNHNPEYNKAKRRLINLKKVS
ncbi:MAG: tetratricopeptide repeat protein [Oligoflexus sp.]